jgi:hypothetical protein
MSRIEGPGRDEVEEGAGGAAAAQRSAAYRRMMIGIFFSRSSFCAILNGSVSSPISTITGAFMLRCVRGKRAPRECRG